MSNEEIVERRERSMHRASDRLRGIGRHIRPGLLKATPIVAALCLIGAGVAAQKSTESIDLGPAAAGPTDFPMLVKESISPTPEPSPSPVPEIAGTGPIFLYGQRVDEGLPPERWHIFAIDLGNLPPDGFPASDFIGEIEGSITLASSQIQSSGGAVVVVATRDAGGVEVSSFWSFRRGGRPERPFLERGVEIPGVIVSPDGTRVAIFLRDQAGTDASSLWVYPASGGEGSAIMSVDTPPHEIGPLQPVAWRDEEILAFASCECDAGPPLAFYSISLAKRIVTRASWLGHPLLFAGAALSADGRTVAVARNTPIPRCTPSEFNNCSKPPQRLVVVDPRRGIQREIARTNELSFESMAVSPDGSLVAYASGRNEEIVVRETSTGKVVTTFSDSLIGLAPLAWVTNDAFLVSGSGVDVSTGSTQRLVELLTLETFDGGEVAISSGNVLAMDESATYLGWLR